ncbi:hypothetical protein EV560_115187 [Bosea sp. BK604]|nr:hypothetical protein EV560_115187 [Bosea sp. BK604]
MEKGRPLGRPSRHCRVGPAQAAKRAVLYVEHDYQADVSPGLFEHDLSVALTELHRDVPGT